MTKRDRIFFAILAVIYFAWNVIAASIHGMQDSYDTSRYYGGVFDIQNPGISTTLLFTIVREPTWIMFALILLSCIAWLALTWMVVLRLHFSPVRWILGGLLLLISMSTPIWSWNTVLLSESLTQTSVVIWLATIIWMMGSGGSYRVQIISSTLAACFVIITRPQFLMIIVPAHIIFLFWRARRPSGEWTISISAALATILFGSWGVYRLLQLASDDLYQYRYAIHNFVDKTPSFRAYALENMPTCKPLEEALLGPAPWTDVLAISRDMIPLCPETWLWFNSPDSRFSNWVLEIPAESWGNFVAVIFGLTFFAMSSGWAMPAQFSDLILSPQQLWLWTGLYAALGLILALIARRHLGVSALGILATIALTASSFAFLFTVWGADGYDLSRHIYPFIPFVGIALLALIPTVPNSKEPAPSKFDDAVHLDSESN